MANSFPVCVEDLTNEWLTQTLHKNGVPDDVAVTGFKVGPVSDPGQTSEVVKIELEYNKDNSGAPQTLMCKFPAKFEQIKTLAVTMGAYSNEVQFFRQIAPTAGDLVPKCYAAEIDEESHNFVLLMEDLSELEMGNPFNCDSLKCSRIMLQNIALFHAKWWNHPDQKNFEWMRNPKKQVFKDSMNMTKMIVTGALPTVKQEFESYMSANAWETVEKFLEHLDELTQYNIDNPPAHLTIIHGDYYYKQAFFPTSTNPRYAIIDWQFVGIGFGALDVVRALIFDPEIRREHEQSLVNEYHRILLGHGVNDYSQEQLWEDMRLATLSPVLIYILVIAQTDNEIFKAQAAEYGVDPYLWMTTYLGSILDDWGVGDAIDRRVELARAAK